MNRRLNYHQVAPEALEILIRQERYIGQQFSNSATLNMTILELVKLRVSQINQCAYCLDMHSKDALKLGESPARIFSLSAWRDAIGFTDQERSALHWAELLTEGNAISDNEYQSALESFGAPALVDLTVAINAINSWNRVVKAFKPEVGVYQPS